MGYTPDNRVSVHRHDDKVPEQCSVTSLVEGRLSRGPKAKKISILVQSCDRDLFSVLYEFPS